MEKSRISELDIFRGICILGMIASHLYYDLTVFAGANLSIPAFFTVLFRYGGILFVLLSGICATLGSHSVRRGALVLFCGLLITAATLLLDSYFGEPTTMVLFGILHLLGICMLLYPLFRRLPTWLLAVLGLLLVITGYYFDTLRVSAVWLFPFGLTTDTFYSADYWPILPHLGFFLLGVFLGRTLYGEKRPRIPALQGKCRFLAYCGRHSLPIYLIQHPVLFVLAFLLARLFW